MQANNDRLNQQRETEQGRAKQRKHEATRQYAAEQAATAIAGRLIRLRTVSAITGLSRSSIYRISADPSAQFPGAVRIGNRAIAWRGNEILEWVASRPRIAAARASAVQ